MQKRFYKNLIFVLTLILIPFSVTTKMAQPEQDIAEIKRIGEINSKTLAETVQNVVTMRQELQSIKGVLEEVQHFFQEGSEKNEKLLKDFDMRMTAMEERLILYESQLKEFLSKGQAAGPHKGREEDVLYRRALTEINLQNYKTAGGLFDQFLQKFPRSSMADNAQYWKGETLYALKDYSNAILEFQKVVKKYPKGEKAPGAILKQGYSFYEMKNYPDAKAFLQLVVSNYPGSEESGYARERIQKIDQLSLAPTTQPIQP